MVILKKLYKYTTLKRNNCKIKVNLGGYVLIFTNYSYSITFSGMPTNLISSALWQVIIQFVQFNQTYNFMGGGGGQRRRG